MTDEPKPPMVVWLDRYAGSVQCLGFYAPKKESLHVNDEGGTKTYGPYVHLDQFLETVEQRIRGNDASDGCEYCWRDEFRKLAKKLKEQNEN